MAVADTETAVAEGLPQGWAWTTVRELSSKPQYGWTTKANGASGTVKLLRTTDISSGSINWSSVPYCTTVPKPVEPYLLQVGDIVISRAGSVGLSALITSVPVPTVFASYLIRFKPCDGISPGFLAYYFQTQAYWSTISEQAAGIALLNVNARKLEAIKVPLAPTSEQHRIVDAIDTQFTRLDVCITGLKAIQAKLKRYRAAVLKAAVDGSLTAAWRAQHPDIEPASALLQRILQERRSAWEQAELAKYARAGKTPPKGWQSKYTESKAPEISGFMALPNGWCWTTIDQVTARSEYGTSVKCDYGAPGVPVLRIPNIAAGEVDLSDIKHATQPLNLDADSALQPGDILMCRTNGSVSLIGKAAVIRTPFKEQFAFASYLLRFRLVESSALPRWLHLYVSSPFGRAFIESHAASSAGQHNISLSLVHNMPFPLPSLEEQEQIVAEVDRRLSVVAEIEAQIQAALKRAERLRQSILTEAFAGRLVPQDPEDEPADILLERIKAQKDGRPARQSNEQAVQLQLI